MAVFLNCEPPLPVPLIGMLHAKLAREGFKVNINVVEWIYREEPELRGRALDAWADEHGVQLYFIDPGKPTQNAYIESFNGRFMKECLNQHWFTSIGEAREIIEDWRIDDNTNALTAI